MPAFIYAGRARNGDKVSGERTAASADDVIALLRREEVLVTRVELARAGSGSKKGRTGRPVAPATLAVFTRQLAVMIDAGLPLVDCLDLLGGQEEDRHFAATILAIRTSVEGGSSLAETMRRHPRTFDSLFTSMIAAGEAAGILAAVCKRLATYLEKSAKLRSQVKSALIYPVAVIVIAGLVVGMILWKVIPTFAALFAGLGAELPLPTRVVIGVSNVLVSQLPAIGIGAVALAYAIRSCLSTARGRYAWDAAALRAPVLGPIVRKLAVARFCRTLSTLLASGVPILDGLAITARTSGNQVIEGAVFVARTSIAAGSTIAMPLKAAGMFPPLVTQMIAVGETTGALDVMLAKIADFYEDDVDAAVGGMLTLLEPLMMAFLGLVVGGIVIAMYLPIFGLISRLS